MLDTLAIQTNDDLYDMCIVLLKSKSSATYHVV